jgi:hypothetical protein
MIQTETLQHTWKAINQGITENGHIVHYTQSVGSADGKHKT